LSAFHAEVGQLPLDELALHLDDLCLEHAATRWLAALVQVLLGVIQEVALAEHVVRTVPGLLDHVQALRDLALRVPMRLVELVGARKRKVTRVRLRHVASMAAGNEASAGVEQRQVAQITRQGSQVLHAESVDLERLVERRIEVHDARDVDHHVDVAT
jgi:hypothetical protein